MPTPDRQLTRARPPRVDPELSSSRGDALPSPQVEKNVAAAKLKLPDDLLVTLEDATAGLKKAMGTNCDLWQGLHADGKFDGRVK